MSDFREFRSKFEGLLAAARTKAARAPSRRPTRLRTVWVWCKSRQPSYVRLRSGRPAAHGAIGYRATRLHPDLRSDAAADQRYRLVQFRLAAPGDVDERAFFNEALGGGETYSAAATSDEGNFSLELWH
jgi:hypothetical protein